MNISTIERSIVHHTNRQRKRHGLRPLKSDKRLTRAARGHSSWMLRRRRLDHTGARQSEPYERARSAGFPTTYVGENIYMTTGASRNPKKAWDTGRAAVRSWMNSSGHRANILSDQYNSIGVGVSIENRTAYMTQNFGQAPAASQRKRSHRSNRRRRRRENKLAFILPATLIIIVAAIACFMALT